MNIHTTVIYPELYL